MEPESQGETRITTPQISTLEENRNSTAPARSPALPEWWRLARGGNALLSGAAALVGVYLSRGDVLSLSALWAVLTPILITAAGNIDNDLCDLEIDRHWKPDRPLAAGTIGSRAARWVMGVCVIAGPAIALAVGLLPFAVAAGVIILLTLYNRLLSQLPVVGNVAVAAMGALPILYGGICIAGTDVERLSVAAFVAVIAFWLHLSREILKDVHDTVGDKVMGRRTLPIVASPEAATRWAAIPMLTAAGFAFWLGLGDRLGILYLFGVIFTVIPALLLGAAQCGVNPQPSVVARWAVGLKLIMAAGLVWIVLGRM